MSVAGTWQLRIATPIGTHMVLLELTEHAGTLHGFARGESETTPLNDLVLDGSRLTWKQVITRPMRLHLTFDVTVDGDTLSGTSKAGKLPASRVSGWRIGAPGP